MDASPCFAASFTIRLVASIALSSSRPDRMARRIASRDGVSACGHPGLVFGTGSRRGACRRSTAPRACRLRRAKQAAGQEAPMEISDACHACGSFPARRELLSSAACRADRQRHDAPQGAVMGARKLVVDALGRVGVGQLVLGVSNTARDAAQHGRAAAAGFEVFLVLKTRLVKMDLAVDDPRHASRPMQLDCVAASPDCFRCAAIFPPMTPAHRFAAAGPPAGKCTVPLLRTRSNVWAMESFHIPRSP